MNKIDEIKEAMDFVDYPDYEFRSFCDELLGILENKEEYITFLQKEKDMLKKSLITIGNIARMKENIWLQEINRHVDDALDSLE